ncbi:MAG: hypothetical protein A2Z88_00920 [Omnitrophica WOR_2 bacterium GWA2_47_8]|nr:MAG: hypothetical protein A2Z88_00920 [Omnitrophica WOR_2 bacterium GWA2_47_8]
MVNNQPFLVKGVDESIYPISAFPTEFGACWHDPAQPSGFYCPPPSARIESPNDIDFLVQTAMGWTAALSANTYRTFGKIAARPSPMLSRANQFGVKVIMGYWINYNIDFTFPGTGGQAARQQLINDFVNYITWLRGDPNYSAVLAHGLSNENNQHWCEWANQPHVCVQCDPNAQAAGFYDLVNNMAQLAKQGDPDPRPIIVVSAELGDIGNATRHADDASLPHIDGWGVNAYRGNSFGNLFTDYAARTQKGVIITEFGMDVWDSRPTAASTVGGKDEATQSAYVVSLWDEIKAEYLRIGGVTAGGTVFQLADTWWGVNGPWTIGVTQHNPGGWSGGFPDGILDDEFLGLFERRPGAFKFQDDLYPRQSAFSIRQRFSQP